MADRNQEIKPLRLKAFYALFTNNTIKQTEFPEYNIRPLNDKLIKETFPKKGINPLPEVSIGFKNYCIPEYLTG